MQGTITAEAGGTIGGFTIGTTDLTATNFALDASGKRITLGSGNDIFIADADEGIWLGKSTIAGAPFAVNLQGAITASTGQIAGALITDTSIGYAPIWNISASTATNDPVSFISSSAFKVSAGGQATASNLLLQGGLIDASPYWKIDRSTNMVDFLLYHQM